MGLTVSRHGAAVVRGAFDGAAPVLDLATTRGEGRDNLIVYRDGLCIVSAGVIKLVYVSCRERCASEYLGHVGVFLQCIVTRSPAEAVDVGPCTGIWELS